MGGTCLYVLDIVLGVSKEEDGDGALVRDGSLEVQQLQPQPRLLFISCFVKLC